MTLPLVSVLCLSFNHKPYIKEALDSVFNQTYKNIEIIVIDDASTDGSKDVIKDYLKSHPDIEFISIEENIGNCKAFNLGFRKARGNYIIDFALDDVLLPTRIEKQVQCFESLSSNYGVVFSDVSLIDKASKFLSNHYKRDKEGNLLEKVPEGDVYKDLLERYFISPPSMLVRREVFERLGGYDESLAYEDFDFWVRSSREFHYYYIDEIQTLKRVLEASHGSKFSERRQHLMLESTLRVCYKAYHLNKSSEENNALAKRIRYHLRQALFTENFTLVEDFYILLKKVEKTNLIDQFILKMAQVKLPLFWLYRLFR